MKKTLFSIVLLGAVLPLSAQTTVFEENFNNAMYPDFPADWQSVSINGGTRRWVLDYGQIYTNMGFSGKLAVHPTNPLSDVVLKSPGIYLEPGNTYSLTFLAGVLDRYQTIAGTSHYGVYALPEGETFTGTETPLIEETIAVSNMAESKTTDLSAYSGQVINLYFRYFNSGSQENIMAIDDIVIVQQPGLGTSEVRRESSVGIYPNPASDYVYLKSTSKITNAEVYDMAGRKMNVKTENERLDVKDLHPGTYIITTESENKKSSHKLIKK
ncbi:MAG: T9SS type A sorting domain-containing protein [Chryseobacterium sp.]|uniref:T9SS-dependent choice-of-anchor J family protein n=1 Tax=Chryseobacterium sp. TaxID=1871047 RepID=UPI002839761F|nr:T9SS type A sorting domain-containing protein [Chryseobacterium sp.]MDR2237005.1 T9SS type A sorting domain-containing protein [Chryseobacterium sp.]